MARLSLFLELEALSGSLEEDEEPASYLSDVTTVPDFIDEAPVEVRNLSFRAFLFTPLTTTVRNFRLQRKASKRQLLEVVHSIWRLKLLVYERADEKYLYHMDFARM